ncbi:MAG: ribonuclease HI [Limnochordaceae bacterium]|nr:ribonuclease HI [Limnochordaceae bacterium]
MGKKSRNQREAEEVQAIGGGGRIIRIWTDGACSGNPGPGGWAAILQTWVDGGLTEQQELSGAAERTTNNRMELTAAIEALRRAGSAQSIEIHSDSQYLIKGIQEWVPRWQANGWRTSRGTAVENQDLWQELLALARQHRIRWQWVRGHDQDPLNKRCDQLAVAASRGLEERPSQASVTGDGEPGSARPVAGNL